MKIQTFLVLSTICAVTSGRRSAPVEKARPAPADHIHNGRHFGWGIGMSNVEAEEEMKQVKLVKRVKKEEGEEKKNHPMLWGMHTLKEVEDCIGME